MKGKANSECHRSLVILLTCAGVTGCFLLLQATGYGPLRDAEYWVQDWMTRAGRKCPVDPRLVLVGINRASYAEDILDAEAEADPVLAAMRERFPWSRVVWAALIERLAAAGARVIVIDLVFATPGEGDAELGDALQKHRGKVVIGSYLNITDIEGGRGEIALTMPSREILQTGFDRPAALDDRVGLVNVWADKDGVLRRARFRLANRQIGDVVDAAPDVLLDSLAARALAKFGSPDAIPADLEPLRFRYAAPPGQGFPVHPLGDVLWPSTWEANYQNGEFFRDKLVLVGPTVEIYKDVHRTPFREPPMFGPELQLNLINAALHGAFLREMPLFARLALAAFFGGLAALVSCAIGSPLVRLGTLAALSVAFLPVALWLHDHADLVVAVVGPLLVLNVGGVTALAFDFVLERIRRARLRHTMSLYFSPRVLEAVLADPGSMEPRRADVTLLLTDLRNSTPLAERLGPAGMFALLNRVFEAQTGAIMSEDGNLEHFLGDQFLSYWGAPQPQQDAADRAARAAQKLIRSMEELKTSLPPGVEALFGYGVALHGGSVLVGNKGSSLRLDYGLVGDVVNEAARVEALTKLYGVKLLVTGQTIGQVATGGKYRLVDRVVVKGKSIPVELYELENPCTPANYAELCLRYEAARSDYANARFAEAERKFKAIIDEFDDGPSRELAARCGRLAENPPADWQGTWILESK